MELGGSTSTLPSGDRAVFLDGKLVSAAAASSRPPARSPRSLDGRPTSPYRVHHFPAAARIYLPYQRHSLPYLTVRFALRAHLEIHSFDATTYPALLPDILDRIGLHTFCSFFTNGPAILAGVVASQT